MSSKELDFTHRMLGGGWHMLDSGYNMPEHTAIYYCVDDGKVLIYDTAHSAASERVIAALATRDIKPEAVELIVVSHAHLDHSGGCGALLKQLPNAKVMAHRDIIKHLVEPAKLIAGAQSIYDNDFDRLYGTIEPVPADRVIPEQSTWELGKRTLQIFNTPGHTFAHLCLHDPQADCVLAGDTFGVSLEAWGGILVIPAAPTQFAPREWKESIGAIMARKPSRIMLSHFGVAERNLEDKAQQLIDEIDYFVQVAREAKEKGSGIVYLQNNILEWWQKKFARTVGKIEPDKIAVELLLATKGLDLWLNKHLETYEP